MLTIWNLEAEIFLFAEDYQFDASHLISLLRNLQWGSPDANVAAVAIACRAIGKIQVLCETQKKKCDEFQRKLESVCFWICVLLVPSACARSTKRNCVYIQFDANITMNKKQLDGILSEIGERSPSESYNAAHPTSNFPKHSEKQKSPWKSNIPDWCRRALKKCKSGFPLRMSCSFFVLFL